MSVFRRTYFPPPNPSIDLLTACVALVHLLSDQALSAQDALQLNRRALAGCRRDVQDREANHKKLSPLLGVNAE